MEFAGQIRFPDLDHPGVPVTFLVDDNQAELVLEGETLGRWSLFDVHARRLVASAFEVDLDGQEITFVAEKPMDFAYRGVEHMAQVWARYKAMNLARRMVAVKWSRRGTIASRIDELGEAMVENLERERSEPDRLAGEQSGGLDLVQPAPAKTAPEETPVVSVESVGTQSVEAERLEADRLALEEERARLEEDRSRLAAEREAAEREVAESIASARAEIERLETERANLARIETEQAERERLGEEQAEKRRLEAEALEVKREELAALEAQRAEEHLEAEREELAALETQRAEERLEAERVEAERVEAERLEAERVEAERVEAERVEAEPAAASQEPPGMVKERLGTSAEASDDDQVRDLVVDLGEFEVPPSQDQPEPVLTGAGQKSGLRGAVRAAFTRSGGKNHVHDFVEAPAGIGLTRSICSECGFVSISTSD